MYPDLVWIRILIQTRSRVKHGCHACHMHVARRLPFSFVRSADTPNVFRWRQGRKKVPSRLKQKKKFKESPSRRFLLESARSVATLSYQSRDRMRAPRAVESTAVTGPCPSHPAQPSEASPGAFLNTAEFVQCSESVAQS